MDEIELLKQKSEVRDCLNKNLYFEKYYITRKQVIKYLYDSNFAAAIKFVFNVCELNKNDKYVRTLHDLEEGHLFGRGSTAAQLRHL